MYYYVSKGFGVLLLVMAVTQFLTLSYFNHIIADYMTPIGGGGILTMFVFPTMLLLVALEALAAAAILIMSPDNIMRSVLMKCGVAATVLWSVFIGIALLRDHPMGYVGLFGKYLRQSLNWFAFVQSLLFVGWSIVTVRIEEDEG